MLSSQAQAMSHNGGDFACSFINYPISAHTCLGLSAGKNPSF